MTAIESTIGPFTDGQYQRLWLLIDAPSGAQ
jgi:hypothetical protein